MTIYVGGLRKRVQTLDVTPGERLATITSVSVDTNDANVPEKLHVELSIGITDSFDLFDANDVVRLAKLLRACKIVLGNSDSFDENELVGKTVTAHVYLDGELIPRVHTYKKAHGA